MIEIALSADRGGKKEKEAKKASYLLTYWRRRENDLCLGSGITLWDSLISYGIIPKKSKLYNASAVILRGFLRRNLIRTQGFRNPSASKLWNKQGYKHEETIKLCIHFKRPSAWSIL